MWKWGCDAQCPGGGRIAVHKGGIFTTQWVMKFK